MNTERSYLVVLKYKQGAGTFLKNFNMRLGPLK